MLFWIDLLKEKRLRIWIHKFFHKSYNDGFIILGLENDKEDNYYGIIILNYTFSIYFKSLINEKRLIIPYAWEGKQQSIIGIQKEE